MPLNRRHFMAGLGAAAGVGILSQNINYQAKASVQKAGHQVAGVYRTKVGDIEVTSIFDGSMQMGPGIIHDADMAEVKRLKDKDFISQDYIPGYLNTFVVQTKNKTILIDTGGGDYAPTTGHLLENLAVGGFKPEQIDEILLTHAHPDHVKGLVNEAGQPVFINALVKLSDIEEDFWSKESNFDKNEGSLAAFRAAKDNLAPYKANSKLEVFGLGDDLGAGMHSVDLRGHTPGHTGYRISSGNDQLLIWGDIVHMQALQFTHPEWSLIYDTDPEQAVKSRMRILDEVAKDRIRIGGMHLSFPGLGHVEKSASGYALVPQKWESEL